MLLKLVVAAWHNLLVEAKENFKGYGGSLLYMFAFKPKSIITFMSSLFYSLAMATAVDQRPLLRTTLNNNTKRRRVANLDKVNHYGIEVIDSITWQGWEPGNEYTKNIVLKNVKVKTQKLKYT